MYGVGRRPGFGFGGGWGRPGFGFGGGWGRPGFGGGFGVPFAIGALTGAALSPGYYRPYPYYAPYPYYPPYYY